MFQTYFYSQTDHNSKGPTDNTTPITNENHAGTAQLRYHFINPNHPMMYFGEVEKPLVN